MPDTPPAVPSPLTQALTTGLNLKISGTLPGEQLLVAAFEYAGTVRGSMDPALQKRLDAIVVQQLEDVQALWRGIWIHLGLVK